MTLITRLWASVLTVSLVATLSSAAYALHEEIKVTPQNSQTTGFTVTFTAPDKGLIRVTIVRDLAKVKSFPADSPNELRRNGTLHIYGKTGLLAQCRIEASDADKTVGYEFEIAEGQLLQCRFTVAEMVAAKGGELQLGGGTLFTFNVGHFVGRRQDTDSFAPPEGGKGNK